MRKAFTLIELLVVVAIIGLLMGMIAPRISSSIRAAREATCRMNLKNLQAAALSRAVDNSGGLPRAGSFELKGTQHYVEFRGWVSWIPDGGKAWPVWDDDKAENMGPHTSKMRDAGNINDFALQGIQAGTLYKYLAKELEVYRCPVAAKDSTFRERVGATARTDKVRLSYLMNEFFHFQGLTSWDPRWQTWIGTRETIGIEYDNKNKVTKRTTPNASRLMLFTEDSGLDWSLKDENDKDVTIGKNCVLCIPYAERLKEAKALSDKHPRIGGYHDGPVKLRGKSDGKIIPWGLAVFLDGHIEKVCPNIRDVASTVKNTAWFLTRGLDSPDKD